MLRIDRHIEVLLMRYDCVILPQFGGFVKHHLPAARSSADPSLLLPPRDIVGFNPQLTVNDSLLVQSYVETYDYSYPEAQSIVDDEVAALQQHLVSEKHCDIGTIGTLTRGDDGTITFAPHSSGLLIPSLYGLAAVVLPAEESNLVPAEDEEKEDDDTPSVPATPLRDDIVLRIPRRILRRVAAAAVILLLVASIPLIGQHVDTRSLRQCSVFAFLMPSAPTEESGATTQEEAPAEEERTPAETAESSTESKEEVPAVVDNTYTVVLASLTSQGNAEHYAQQLHDTYDIDTEVLAQGNTFRVASGKYKRLSDAQEARHALAVITATPAAWVAPRPAP